jgi:hypothetical protein
VCAARAEQARDTLDRLAGIDAQIVGDVDDILSAELGALGGLPFAADQLFGERPAAGGAASTTVRARQQVVHGVDPRVLVDLELLVRQRDEHGEGQGHASKDQDRGSDGGEAHARATRR